MAKETRVTKVEKVIITIAGKTLELTPDQAKELRDILADMFGTPKDSIEDWKRLLEDMKPAVVPMPDPMPYPLLVPTDPWSYHPRPWRYWEPVITCTTTTTGSLLIGGEYRITCKA